MLWPETPSALADVEIAQALDNPVGQAPIRELARKRSRPVIIVDDLTRPTPAARVMPHVLKHLAAAGFAARDVTIIMGTGTHGPPGPGGLEKKLGAEAAASCRVLVHDHRANCRRVGRTSFGTPVYVNREVAAADFLIGIGGVYPQNSTGFGGGSKLALGVLGRRSISRLHFGHQSMMGSYEIDNDFRRDLDEIARMIGLHTTVAVHVDADRQPVRVVCGDHTLYYREAVEFSRRGYKAPLPGRADVVICNAYPVDVSLTMMRIKGIIPLLHAKREASRVVIAACSEGVGYHDLFPFIGGPRFARQRNWARKAMARPTSVPRKAARKLWGGATSKSPQAAQPASSAPHANPIWLYVPGEAAEKLPRDIPQLTRSGNWQEMVETVGREQGQQSQIDVVVYPCAPLHVLELPEKTSGLTGRS